MSQILSKTKYCSIGSKHYGKKVSKEKRKLSLRKSLKISSLNASISLNKMRFFKSIPDY